MHTTMAKGSKSGTTPAPAEIAQQKVALKNPELEEYRKSVKRASLCTPTIDKAGAWSWRGKQLELIWETMTAKSDTVRKEAIADAPIGGFIERYECAADDMLIIAGNCKGAKGVDGKDESSQTAFAVVYAPGKLRDATAIKEVLELPLPLAFVCVHMLSTIYRIFFTRDKVLALLNPNASSAIADVKECISWMRDRLAAVERSPQAILTRCAEIFRTSKEMHAHYLNQVKASGARTSEAMAQHAAKAEEDGEKAATPEEKSKAAKKEVAVVEEEGEEDTADEEEEAAAAAVDVADGPDAEEAEAEEEEEGEEEEETEEETEESEESEETISESEQGIYDDDEATWPAAAALHAAQRAVAQETERCRVARRALERAEAALEKAKEKVAECSDALHDERARRHAKRERRAERKAEAEAKEAEAKAAKEAKEAKAAKSPQKAPPKALASRAEPSRPAGNTEANQIGELEALEAKAAAPLERLLTALRGFASKTVTAGQMRTHKGLDPLRFLTHCDVVVQCAPLDGGDSKGEGTSGAKKKAAGPGGCVGRWFVAMGSSKCLPPLPSAGEGCGDNDGSSDEEHSEEDLGDIDDGASRIVEVDEAAEAAKAEAKAAEAAEAAAELAEEAEREEESVVMCLAQGSDGKLVGAVGWYDLGALPSSLPAAVTLDEPLPPPRRCVRLDDESWEGMGFLHMTLQGYGADCAPIVPMGYNLFGSALFHFAAGMADYHLAREQIELRLSQGRAGMDERNHARTLLDACFDRYGSIAPEASEGQWVPPLFSKCESAVQGLRKTLLRRPWSRRCEACGVRHEDIEFSTCKFWQAWVV